MVSCYKQATLSESEKSCKNQCTKKLSCHHRCLSLCHSGPCRETEKCRRKVKVTCKCKHLKKDIECFLTEELVEGKFLNCNPQICNVQKSPKDTGAPKKRNRKKKTSEGDKDAQDETATTETIIISDTSDSSQSGSFGSDYKKIAVLVCLGGAVLLLSIFLYSGTSTAN